MNQARRWMPIGAALVLIGASCLQPLPTAAAQPDGFPDVSKFTEISGNFSRPGEVWNGYAFFRTPDGLNCAVGSTTWCKGDIPGLATEQKGVCAYVIQDNSRGTPPLAFSIEPADHLCPTSSDSLLDVGQKLTFPANNTTTCVVGENRMTACVNAQGAHGFVLQPSGSWTF
ncbi:hypothetical protein [Mycolicibacterium peregrinum]|uniref:Uncharacterized protein n=1 Tax=Mycolicibacterium peregrinum TaxID=43304 RepID=A0A4Z0HL36_MYCPR|nr:hypothetical protein [Mycolicibacterium peregrinum]TGB36417.1 hypothetical protein EJD98_29200 [Mycolicibacterium peregrinum]TGB37082.1 hypothetical protein EJD94_27860 [Mycolicibacterium peregrinum]